MTHPYASARYAEVFSEVARPMWVPAWETHVLVRPLPDGSGRDAMGVYPLTTFGPEPDLQAGLDHLRAHGLVCVGLVPDPATSPPQAALAAAFGLCAPFKSHFMVDYAREARFSRHHRYEVRKARREVSVEVVALADHQEAWRRLHATLVRRHAIGGIGAFSADAFERLARVDGLVTVAAFQGAEICSMHLWAVDRERGFGHSLLAASSEAGYGVSAAYAVYDASISLFAELKTLNLGAGAGLTSGQDGLTRFKAGFANAEAQAYFCGAVLDEARYAALARGAPAHATPFPSYRFGQA